MQNSKPVISYIVYLTREHHNHIKQFEILFDPKQYLFSGSAIDQRNYTSVLL